MESHLSLSPKPKIQTSFSISNPLASFAWFWRLTAPHILCHNECKWTKPFAVLGFNCLPWTALPNQNFNINMFSSNSFKNLVKWIVHEIAFHVMNSLDHQATVPLLLLDYVIICLFVHVSDYLFHLIMWHATYRHVILPIFR